MKRKEEVVSDEEKEESIKQLGERSKAIWSYLRN